MLSNVKQSILLLLLIIASALPLHAQPFATQWMRPSEHLDAGRAVWFRRTFLHHARPKRAFITMATTGKAIVYVNGRNVSTAQYTPQRTQADTTAIAITYDITHYMRSDTNIVTVLVAPTTHLTPPHIAVCYYGISSDSTRYALASPEGWLCSPSATSLSSNDTNESMNGLLYLPPLAIAESELMRWLPIATSPQCQQPIIHEEQSVDDIAYIWPPHLNPFSDIALRTHATLHPRYFNRESEAIVYDFSPGFYALVRVTLRGCRKGECINISGLTYTSRGEIDEQAISLFTPIYGRRIVISGDSHFCPDQVQNVEAICF